MMQSAAVENVRNNWLSIVTVIAPVLIVQLFQFFSSRRQEKKLTQVHTLVNSQTEASLALIVSVLKQLLATDPENTSVRAQLETQQKALSDHLIKQAIIDARDSI